MIFRISPTRIRNSSEIKKYTYLKIFFIKNSNLKICVLPGLEAHKVEKQYFMLSVVNYCYNFHFFKESHRAIMCCCDVRTCCCGCATMAKGIFIWAFIDAGIFQFHEVTKSHFPTCIFCITVYWLTKPKFGLPKFNVMWKMLAGTECVNLPLLLVDTSNFVITFHS